MKPLPLVITAFLAGMAGVTTLHGANASWLGITSGDWADDTNWSAAHPNGTTDIATFNGASSNTTVEVGTRLLNRIVFSGAATPGYVLGTGAATFGNGTIIEVQNSVVSPQTISAEIKLGGTGDNNPSINNSSSIARLTVSGNITSVISGTRNMALVGNSAQVTEFSGNFGSTLGKVSMQVQSGTGIFSGTCAFDNFSVTNVHNLMVNGSVTSTNVVAVNDAARIGGTGSITGNVEVRAAAVLPQRTGPIVAPGDSTATAGYTTGTLAVSGNFTLVDRAAPTAFNFEIGGSSPADGAGGYDQLNAGGAVSLGRNVAGTATTSVLSVSLVNGYTPAPGAVYYLVSRGDGAAFGARTFAGLPEGAAVDLGGGHSGTITYLANWQGSQAASSTTGGNDIAIITGEPTLALPLLEVVLIKPGDETAGAKLYGILSGGTPNTSVRVEASTDLGISDAWETIGTVPLDANGEASINELEDTGSVGAPKSFFRVAVP